LQPAVQRAAILAVPGLRESGAALVQDRPGQPQDPDGPALRGGLRLPQPGAGRAGGHQERSGLVRRRRVRVLLAASAGAVASGAVPLAAMTASATGGGAVPAAAAATSTGASNQGKFESVCFYSHSAKDDPIVVPGRPGAAAHLHDFLGNPSTDANS